MGSPEGVGRDKYLSKRRKSESSHYLKSRDWDDGRDHEEDRKLSSSKSKKSSKGDRERDKAREKDRDREREHDRVVREGRSKDEYYDECEKRLRSYRGDRHEERAERDNRELVESRAVGSKRRNPSERVSKENEVVLVQEMKKSGGADHGADFAERIVRKHDRAHDLDKEKLRKCDPRMAKSRDKERSSRGEARADRGDDGEDEKYGRSDSRTARGEGLDDKFARKRKLHRERYYVQEDEKLGKRDNRAERSHDNTVVDIRKLESRAGILAETDAEKVRQNDAYVEEAQNGDMKDYLKVGSRAERTYEFRDILNFRKYDHKAGRAHDIDDETNYDIDLRHVRSGKTIISSELDPCYSKSRKSFEERNTERAAARIYSQEDEKELRIGEPQGERRERYVESSGVGKYSRSSSRHEKSREHFGRDKDTGERDKPFSVVDSGEGAPDFLSSEVHKWDRKRNGSVKMGEEGIKRQEIRKDWPSGIVQIVEESVVARLEHQQKLRGSPGSYENVSGITNEKGNSGHGRPKEKLLSRWDYPEPKLEVVIEESSQEGTGMERIDRKWGEPEQDIFNSRALEVEPENLLRGSDYADEIEGGEMEEGYKSPLIQKLENSSQVADYEDSQDFKKLVAIAEAEPGEGEGGDGKELEKPERNRREKERLEKEELDEWEKSTQYREKGSGDWAKEKCHFDHIQGRDKSEWQDLEVGNNLEGEMEESGNEVPRLGPRRGRDTLEREDFDLGGKFLGGGDREREREREQEKGKGTEWQRERDKGKERERERKRRDEHYWDDQQLKGSEHYDDRYCDQNSGGKSSVKGRENRGDHVKEKYRSRGTGREELDDRHRRVSWDRKEDERTGKLASKESTHDFVRDSDVAREKVDEDGSRRLRWDEEKGKKALSRDSIEEAKLGRSKVEDLVDKVHAIEKDSGPDLPDGRCRLKGKHGRPVTSPQSPDDRGELYKGGTCAMSSRNPDDRRRGHKRSYTLAGCRSPAGRRGGCLSSKAVTNSRSPDDRRDHRRSKANANSRSHDRRVERSDWEDVEGDWSDGRGEYDRAKSCKKRRTHKRDYDSSERECDRYRSREGTYDRSWERRKGKDKADNAGRSYDRHQNHSKGSRDAERGRDSDFQVEQDIWESKKRHEIADREKPDRRMPERESSESNKMDRDLVEGLRSTQGFASMSDSTGQGRQLPPNFAEPGRGFCSHGGPYMPPGDYFGGMGEIDWDGPTKDDRIPPREGIFLGGDDRFMDNDCPVGHDPGYGPGRGTAGDGGMSYNPHPGRGRGSKVSPNNRGRGGMMGHEGRLHFNNNHSGPMLRGMQQQQHQQGGKVQGPRGGPKGARGHCRELQRPSVNPLLMGPGISPHYGPMGPQELMPGMGMGPGSGPGPTPGPNLGRIPLLSFGGPMGWGVGPGVSDMGMMGCPPGPAPVMGLGSGGLGPRFGPGMVPGPGPKMFSNPPGPGRGSHGVMSIGSFGGGVPPFSGQSGGGGRGQISDRGPPGGGRGLVGRASGLPGRGPSRGEQNDYSQHFVDTGLRPQNFIRYVELADRFEEYPKLKELITRKDQLIAKRATPPMYMQCDLRTTDLYPDVFGIKFDVILVDPPWEEYVRRAPGTGDSMEWWSAEEIQNLRIEAIADTPAFIFLWVGGAEGLEQGRLCLKKWGFRRCEDICWVKTNRENPTPALRHDSNTLFQHSKEHCLMGIKGTVRRSTDGHIIHANVDTDIIISEEPEYGSTQKPEELYHIIEHFAQGMRRIELFGEDHNIRSGWVTAGKGLTSSNFNPQTYAKNFTDLAGKVWQGARGNPVIDAPHLVGTTPEIEALRPKSPPPRPQAQPSGQGNGGNSLSQPSAGNFVSKKISTGQAGGVQNGHPAALIPGAGHGSANPPGTGSVVIGQSPCVGGRGGGHGQIPKICPILPGPLVKAIE